jgi:hypothetical protein
MAPITVSSATPRRTPGARARALRATIEFFDRTLIPETQSRHR